MATWQPVLDPTQSPLYLALADLLEQDIEAGRLAPGTRLPTQRELARSLGVHLSTVTRACKEAARRGLLDGEVGRGTFVRRGPARELARERVARGTAGAEIDLGFNLPIGGPDEGELGRALADMAREGPSAALLHGYHFAGLASHREAGAQWLRRCGLEATGERTLVTGGAQHGMTMALATLARPGDTVLVESLTYPGVRALADLFGLKLRGVAMDAEGLLPDALDAACESSGARALYTMPNVHNPTGVVMSLERRERIAAVARRRELSIVEDDTYGFLLADPPPPLAALAPERTLFVSSLSKCLASGLRVGYLHAPPELGASIERLAAAGAAVAWMVAPLMAELATRWLTDGTALRAIEWKRAEARARRAIADRVLVGQFSDSHPASCHLWLRLPERWRAEDLATSARQRGVLVTPTAAFAVGRAGETARLRLCIGTPPTREELERGLAAIATLLAGAPEPWSAVV